MWIIAIAWLYVTVIMALAEATSPQGSILGAVFTFLLYGLGPLSLVMYVLGTPARRRARRAAEALEAMQGGEPPAKSSEPDGSGHAPANTVAPEGKEP